MQRITNSVACVLAERISMMDIVSIRVCKPKMFYIYIRSVLSEKLFIIWKCSEKAKESLCVCIYVWTRFFKNIKIKFKYISRRRLRNCYVQFGYCIVRMYSSRAKCNDTLFNKNSLRVHFRLATTWNSIFYTHLYFSCDSKRGLVWRGFYASVSRLMTVSLKNCSYH